MTNPVDDANIAVLSAYFAPHIRPGVEHDADYSRARAAWRAHERFSRKASHVSSTGLAAAVDVTTEAAAAQVAIAKANEHLGNISAAAVRMRPGRDEPPEST